MLSGWGLRGDLNLSRSLTWAECWHVDQNLLFVKVWTTPYKRTQDTGRYIVAPKVVRPELGEISAGEHDNMTYEEIAEKFPVEFALRDADKLCYRYPGGESYLDVVER